jgi:hypothetical protein
MVRTLDRVNSRSITQLTRRILSCVKDSLRFAQLNSPGLCLEACQTYGGPHSASLREDGLPGVFRAPEKSGVWGPIFRMVFALSGKRRSSPKMPQQSGPDHPMARIAPQGMKTPRMGKSAIKRYSHADGAGVR